MASDTIIANSPTDWQFIKTLGESVHLAIHGVFDGATVAVEQEINGIVYPLLDNGVAITHTVATDTSLAVNGGDKIRLNASGGGASLALDFNIAGGSLDR